MHFNRDRVTRIGREYGNKDRTGSSTDRDRIGTPRDETIDGETGSGGWRDERKSMNTDKNDDEH